MKSIFLFRYLLYLSLISLFCHISACTKTEKESDKNENQQEPVEFYYHESEYKDEPSEFSIDKSISHGETTLTNSVKVNHQHFPEAKYAFLDIGQEDFPWYKNDTGPWVVLDAHGLPFTGKFGLSIHLSNLPDTYVINIYDNNSNLFRNYTVKKEEINIQNYYFYFGENDLEEVKKILPFSTFYFPQWLSHTKQNFKTEICTVYGEVLFSTYIEYPTIPFIVDGSYLQYSGDSSIYVVLYQEADDMSGSGFPIDAFLITPENDFWEGTLSIFTNQSYGGFLLVLYKMDQDKPDDYSKRVDNTWLYRLR